MTGRGHRATGFGLLWRADLPLAEFAEADDLSSPARAADVDVHRVSSLAERHPGRTVNRGSVHPDGIRLGWNREVTFDMFDGAHIHYLPGEHWKGSLPSCFYSTIAALTLAWRGSVPLHASAIEFEGRAFAIAGASGAGKSSLAAGLIALGGSLVADDLTVIRAVPGRAPEVFPGRPAMRQHPGTAAITTSESSEAIPGDPRHKWLVRPRARSTRASLPLGGILLLGSGEKEQDSPGKVASLASNLFRPRWLAALPNYASLRHDLLAIASAVPIQSLPAIGIFSPRAQLRRAEEALSAIRAMRPR